MLPHRRRLARLRPTGDTELKSSYFPRERAERLIAHGRLLIALAAMAAVGLGSRAAERGALNPVLIGFSLYAALLAVLVEKGALPDAGVAVAMQTVDLAFFAVLLRGPDGPAFFVCFTYALLAAALRWDWRGVLWTAVAAMALAALLAIGTQPTHQVFARMVYISVLASMIAMLRVDEEGRRNELKRLSSWNISRSSDRAALLTDTVRFAAGVLEAPRVLLAWEDADEPWMNLAYFDGSTVAETRASNTHPEGLVAPELARTAFACVDLTPPATALTDAGGKVRRWRGAPVDPAVASRHAMCSVVSSPFSFDTVEGRLFALDLRSGTSDDLVLARAAGVGVAARLQNIARWQQIGSETATRERLRLARELHDGVLQFLAGTALQIESVRQLLDGRVPEPATNRLLQIGEWIKAEQRALRFFVGELRPGGGPGREDAPSEGLRELADRVGRHWNIEVEFEAGGLPSLPRSLFEEIGRLIQEAVVNAARHARASRVRVAVGAEGRTIRILIDDNGEGFAFSGRWDLESLNRERIGPVSLKERVSALGGSLTIASQKSGSVLDITVPWLAGP